MFMPKKIKAGEAKGQKEIEARLSEKYSEPRKTDSEKQKENLNIFLVAVDVFSRYGWIRQIPNKQAATLARAFENIFKETNRKPKKLWSDRGGEFTGLLEKGECPDELRCPICGKCSKNKNGLMQHLKWHEKNPHKAPKTRLKGDVEIYHTEGKDKVSIIERWIRTIKDRIGRWMTDNNTTEYIPHLQDIVEDYNNTPHRNFKDQYTPTQASKKENEKKIYKKFYENAKPRKFRKNDNITQKIILDKNDLVRVAKVKSSGYEKGSAPKWSNELFKIREIKNTNPTTYYLKDANDHDIIGTFYRQELQKSRFNMEEWMGYDKPRRKIDVRLGMEAVQKEAKRQKDKKQRQREKEIQEKQAQKPTPKPTPKPSPKPSPKPQLPPAPSTSQQEEKHICEHCGKSFSSKKHVTRHQKESCPVLKGELTKEQALAQTEKKTDFQCEHCGKYFSSKKHVKRHQKESCPVLKQQSASGLEISKSVKSLPIKSLNNFELIDICKHLKGWRGVFSRDTLPPKPRMYECGILNLDDSEGPGTHWTCWHRNKKLKFYFDSYGLPPPLEFRKYMKSPILYSSDQIQNPGTVICGHLCVHVLQKLNKGFHLQPITSNLMDLKEKGLI